MWAYFPQGQRWYTLTLNETVAAGLSVSPFVDTVDAGVFKYLYTPLTATNIHVRVDFDLINFNSS